jgi:hypothetical protein
MDKNTYNTLKKERRIVKKATKRHATSEEVLFIFEKVLAGWKTIRIFNTLIQQNPNSQIDKKKVEQIATGNCKVDMIEFALPEKYSLYCQLREQVYTFLKK